MTKNVRNAGVLASCILILGFLPAVLYRVQFGGVPQLSPGAAKRMLVSRPQGTLLLDVRTAAEYEESHLRGAVSWPLSDILRQTSLEGLPAPLRGKTLLALCPGGVRSVKAVRRLRSLGLTDVFNIRDGMIAWIGDANNPVGQEYNTLVLSDGGTQGLPEKTSTFVEQFALVVSSFVFKPIYMLVAIALAVFLWRKKGLAFDLRVLGMGLALFSLGEIACFVNYTFFHGNSYPFDYLHSWGMVLSFGFTTFALFEALDMRLIRFSHHEERCAFLPLCRQCYKTGDVACRLFRTFLYLSVVGAALALIPLTARPYPVSYNTRIFGTFFNFGGPLPSQLFEVRYCPAVAALLFAAAGLVLLFHQRRPSALSKVLFAGAGGYIGFSFFRLFLYAPYHDNVVWLYFWEEATEIIYIAALVVVFWLFRKGLFPKSERPPA